MRDLNDKLLIKKLEEQEAEKESTCTRTTMEKQKKLKLEQIFVRSKSIPKVNYLVRSPMRNFAANMSF